MVRRNKEKEWKKQLQDRRRIKGIQRKSLKLKGYSESKVSGRIHQNSDLEDRKCGKTCKRGLAWSFDINDT